MLLKVDKRISMFIAVILSLILLATPAMAGYVTADFFKKNSSLDYTEITGKELESLAEEALKKQDVRILLDKLTGGSYEVSEKRAANYVYSKKQGNVLILTIKGSKDIQLVYADFNGKVKVGAGVLQNVNGTKTIDVYDIKNGKIYNTSKIEIINNQPKINWKEGPFIPYDKKDKTGSQKEINAAWTSCDICLGICNTLWNGGCGLTSYFACMIACSPFGNFTCPIICGVVYSIICGGVGSYITCPSLCQDIGYCK